MIKERGILFGPGMVLAILGGRKSQTRRVGVRPHGEPGDRLWVRETWAADWSRDDMAPSSFDHDVGQYWYRADHYTTGNSGGRGRWRSSIHMPRFVSRIELEVEAVWHERLQEISPEDAVAEGVGVGLQVVAGFHNLWDSINLGRGLSWESNPWVWVMKFRRVEAP